MATDHDRILGTLAALQHNQAQQELSIVRLTEPFTSAGGDAPDLNNINNSNNQDDGRRDGDEGGGGGARNSDASNATTTTTDNSTMSPASLEADLAHYKDLFSKLRFSYLEQVTKEKFLRAIVGDPPLVVEASENTALEAELAEVKASLKAQKVEVAELVEELERKGVELGQRHQNLTSQIPLLSTLPDTVASLRETNATLQKTLSPTSSSSLSSSSSSSTTKPAAAYSSHHQLLPLPATQSLLSDREAEIAALDAQLATLHSTLPRQTTELGRLQKELVPLETRRDASVRAAEEARRKKLEGEGDGGGEERGRWLRACEVGVRGLLGVEA
ncbi:MAG: hypothetical protein M1837_000334 [Sclerophora amabilis]|nr:MAG: hypothetical protein M1837_000334 [Sclerophora amabilis]